MTAEDCKGMARTMLLVAACIVFVVALVVIVGKNVEANENHQECAEDSHG